MNSADELTVNKTLRPESWLVAETRADSSICCETLTFVVFLAPPSVIAVSAFSFSTFDLLY